MKHTIKSVVLGLSLILANGSIVYAQDLEKGLEAYSDGDYAAALREWRPLAKQGNADAQYNLGVMYDEGEGTNENNKEAVRLYNLSAAQGNANAQNKLGEAYEAGSGVIQDYTEAEKWYRLSAAQGNEESQYRLGVLYTDGRGVTQDNVYAHMWCCPSSDNLRHMAV